jgi:hypothetical protein
VVRQVEEGAYSPFLIDSDSRILGIVRHPEFNNPKTVAEVFTGLLNQGEFRRESAIDWAVEPVLDEDDFFDWLSRTPVVERVRFVAKVPNPDAIEGHEFINARLDRLNADRIQEEISTQSESGLQKLREDSQALGFVESARQRFGYVTAQGHTQSGSRHFDQRQQLARESLEVVPGSWTDLVAGLMATVERWLANRREREDEA